MLSDAFKAEIDYLIQLCEELGTREPALAPVLGRGADPAVTRLVEGLAFAFGRLRQRLDDDLPEIIHPVLDNLCPEILRPLPSATVMELAASPKMMSRHVVKAGSTFAARPIDGISCLFRSAADCEVAPWRLAAVDVAGPDRRAVRLRLDLFDGAELAASLPSTLRLFFALPLAAALSARSFFLRATSSVMARSPSGPRVELASPTAAALHAFTAGEAAPLAGAAAFLDVRDYFAFPQRFAFIDIPETNRLAALGPETRSIELELALREPLPRGLPLDVTSIALHAVPAVNVFRPPSPLSVPLSGDRRRCRLQFGEDLEGAAIYAVEHVALVSRGLQSTPAMPWARFFPPHASRDAYEGAGPDGRTPIRYEVRRSASVIGAELDVSLAFDAPGEPDWIFDDMLTADVQVLATNGTRAAGVGLGDVCLSTSTSPSLVTFRNLSPVTRAIAPVLDGDRAWRFFRFLKSNLPSVTEPSALSSLLALANLPAVAEWPDAKPGPTTFAPLVGVDRRRMKATARDELHLGASIRVVVDGRRFNGAADIDLFGEILAPLLASTIRPHEWIDLTVADTAGATFAYPRAHGTRRGL